MKTTLTVCTYLLMSTSAYALDLTYGKGDFDITSSLNPFISTNVTLDINTVSLAEQHKNIKNSNYYYHFKLDYFDSDTVNKMTDIASTPISTVLPLFGTSFDDYIANNTQIPVPTDYRIHGIDFDIGLGYDLIKDEKTTVGISVNTGLSTPFMKMRNMKSSTTLFIDALDTFDTKIKTYKLGASGYAQHKINNQLILSANGSVNMQTGEMDNDLIGSGIDVDGSYIKFNLNLKYKPSTYKNLYFTTGYTFNKWDYDSMKVKMPISSFNIPRNMDIDFESNNIYLGIGYSY